MAAMHCFSAAASSLFGRGESQNFHTNYTRPAHFSPHYFNVSTTLPTHGPATLIFSL
jgi:hypothetical protein